MKKLFVASLLLLLAACGGSGETPTSQDQRADAAKEPAVKSLTGAGSSFAFPIVSAWAYDYNKTAGVELNYQSIGSGGGIRQIKEKTVDFGASDAPMKAEELTESGLVQFPFIMGGVVPVVNVPGVEGGKLKLDPDTLAAIFLGQVKKWNDPKITGLNEGLALPDKAISVVHRADGSGTTWIFTNYLMKVSEAWKNGPGTGKAVDWPTGMGGKGNEGVASYVTRLEGSIGYVEYAYALQNNLAFTLLKSADGNYVAPSSESFQSAASGADWANAPGFYMVLTNQPGPDSWPITGAVFALVQAEQDDAAKAKGTLDFFDWAYKNGGSAADRLHYVAMPDDVVTLVQKTWAEKVKSGGTPVWK